jgi:hypothetical protein
MHVCDGRGVGDQRTLGGEVMMLSDLIADLRGWWPWSSAWISVGRIGSEPADHSLSMRWEVQGVPDHCGEWDVRCRGVHEARMRDRGGHDIQLTAAHPLLLRYQEPSVDLYFRGVPASASALLGDLYLAHRRIVGDWVNPADILNQRVGDLEALIASGAGMLASGPKSVVREYAAVSRRHGVSVRLCGFDASMLAGRREATPDGGSVEVLILDRSYVVAREFTAELVS